MHQCHHLQPVYHGQLYVRIPKTKKRHTKRGRLQRKWETGAEQVVLIMVMYGICTVQGTNISHLGKRKIIFKMSLKGDMLVPRRASTCILDFKSIGKYEQFFSRHQTPTGLADPMVGCVTRSTLWLMKFWVVVSNIFAPPRMHWADPMCRRQTWIPGEIWQAQRIFFTRIGGEFNKPPKKDSHVHPIT